MRHFNTRLIEGRGSGRLGPGTPAAAKHRFLSLCGALALGLAALPAPAQLLRLNDGDLTISGTATVEGFTLPPGAADGAVLTSDGTGVGTWQAVPSPDVWATVSAETGSTTANAPTDTLSIIGSGSVATSIVGDTLTVTGAGLTAEMDGSISNELQNLFATVTADSGSTTADTQTDTLSIVGSGSVATSIAGDTVTVTGVGLTAEVDGSISNELQNLFATVTGDTGSSTADTQTDTLSIVGSGSVATSIVGDTLTVTGSVSTQAGDPGLAGSVGIGTSPRSVYVSGRYAYVVDFGSDDLKVIDVSAPSAPSLAGSLGIGAFPQSVYVSGRYAYVVDSGSEDLKVIDVSDPSTPSLAGSLGIGGTPRSVYVSGRYAYVVDATSDDLKVIDVSAPSTPSLAGSLALGASPQSVYVSGRYAYVVDDSSDDLKVIDVSGGEVPALFVHSLEAGNLQVQNDILAQGQLQVSGGLNVGAGGVFSAGDVGVGGDVTVTGDLTIGGSCSGCASDLHLKQNIQPLEHALTKINQLRGVSYDWQAQVREAGLYPGRQIGVLGQEVEAVFPELVGTDSRGYKFVRYQQLVAPLIEAVKELAAQKEAEIQQLQAKHAEMEHRLEAENATIERRLEAEDEALERRLQALESRVN